MVSAQPISHTSNETQEDHAVRYSIRRVKRTWATASYLEDPAGYYVKTDGETWQDSFALQKRLRYPSGNGKDLTPGPGIPSPSGRPDRFVRVNSSFATGTSSPVIDANAQTVHYRETDFRVNESLSPNENTAALAADMSSKGCLFA